MKKAKVKVTLLEEDFISRDTKVCPKCGTDKWWTIRCICHRVCWNRHTFRVKDNEDM